MAPKFKTEVRAPNFGLVTITIEFKMEGNAFANLFDRSNNEGIDHKTVLKAMRAFLVKADKWQFPTEDCACCRHEALIKCFETFVDDDTSDATLKTIVRELCGVVKKREERRSYCTILTATSDKPAFITDLIVNFMTTVDTAQDAPENTRLEKCAVFVALVDLEELEKGDKYGKFPAVREALTKAWAIVGRTRKIHGSKMLADWNKYFRMITAAADKCKK